MNFLSHLACGMCGERYAADKIWNLCPQCGKPLLARYDLEAANRALPRDVLVNRAPNIWRYHELLPVQDELNTRPMSPTLGRRKRK